MADDRLHFAGFDIAFRGRSVDVIVLPRAADEPAPTADAVIAALKRTPLERAPRDLITRSLEAAVDSTAETKIPVGQVSAQNNDPAAVCTIVLSADSLAAFAVPSVPSFHAEAAAGPAADAAEEPGEDPAPALPAFIAARRVVTAGQLSQLLAAANVTFGVLADTVAAFGLGEPLAEITCVAMGEPPVAGIDGSLEFLFDRSPRLAPRVREDGSVDFHAMLVERFVEAGAVLVTRRPPVPERAGQTVLGEPLLLAPPRDALLAPLAGEHTEVRGEDLVATLGGRPMENAAGRIDIVPVYEVPGDLDYGVGNIDFPGDVIVRGDVKPGFTISAAGSVVVQGVVESATITVGRDLTVMGVVGEHWSRFTVGGDLNAQYLHTTSAEVTGTITVAREIVNCRLNSERVAMGSTGRMVGGTVTARVEIDAGAIGAANGTLTETTVLSREPSAVIRARRAAHPGAVIRVGGARREISDELVAVSFWDVAGQLLTLRAAADEHEVHAAQQQAPGAA